MLHLAFYAALPRSRKCAFTLWSGWQNIFPMKFVTLFFTITAFVSCLGLAEEALALPPKPELADIARAVIEQERAVEESRKKLEAIIAERGIIETDGTFSVRGFQSQEELNDQKTQIARLDRLIDGLRRLEGDQKLLLAAAIDIPENQVRARYLEYYETKSEMEKLRTDGSGAGSPEWILLNERVALLEAAMESAVALLINTLMAQSEKDATRLEIRNVPHAESREEAIQRGLDAQEFVEAKKRYETDKLLLGHMKAKLMETILEGEN